MLSINWNEEKMSVGIDLIDEQHKKLLELINDIIKSVANNRQVEDIEEFIDKTLKYSEYHFDTEERLFREYNVDINEIEEHIKEHKKEHEDFKNMINKIFIDLDSDKSLKSNYGIEILTDLYTFLTKWFVQHIIEEDKKIFKRLTVNNTIENLRENGLKSTKEN